MTELHLTDGVVRLRERYPFKDNRDLIPLYRAMQADKPETLIPVAVKMVESWDLPGDPKDPAAYEEIDAIDLWRLFRFINDFWAERVLLAPKPSANGSIEVSPSEKTNSKA
jgi:hypothetical protein